MQDEVLDIQKLINEFSEMRTKYKQMDLRLTWYRTVKEQSMSRAALKSLYEKRISTYPGLKNYHNQLEVKTIIKKKGKTIKEVEEYFISGRKETIFEDFGIPPKLPDDLTDVLDDYDEFIKFANGAIELGDKPRSRMYDSELKYIFNFLKRHSESGDEFMIEVSSLIKVCVSCSRELLMLQKLMLKQGKKINFVVKHDKKIKIFKKLLEKIN